LVALYIKFRLWNLKYVAIIIAMASQSDGFMH
jgi:hypothetical protein